MEDLEMLLCCFLAANLFVSVWIAIKCDQIREKIEEVLRWL